jgi:hypothetical protein
MSPVYVMLFIQASEVARECGYALAVHGTLARDIDILAAPWTDAAVPAEVLVQKIAERVGWLVEGKPHLVGPEKKPHGRLAWSIPYYAENFIDISVMPRLN